MKQSCTSLAFTSYKKKSVTSLPASFTPWFLKKKKISLVIFYWLTKFHCLVLSTLRDIWQYVCCNFLLTRLWNHKFWNDAYIFNQVGFSTWSKCQDQNLNIFRMQRVFIEADKSYLFGRRKFNFNWWNSSCKANKIRVYWEEFPTIFLQQIPYLSQKSKKKAQKLHKNEVLFKDLLLDKTTTLKQLLKLVAGDER